MPHPEPTGQAPDVRRRRGAATAAPRGQGQVTQGRVHGRQRPPVAEELSVALVDQGERVIEGAPCTAQDRGRGLVAVGRDERDERAQRPR